MDTEITLNRIAENMTIRDIIKEKFPEEFRTKFKLHKKRLKEEWNTKPQ